MAKKFFKNIFDIYLQKLENEKNQYGQHSWDNDGIVGVLNNNDSPKGQLQLREEMLNNNFGAALSDNAEKSIQTKNVVGDIIVDAVTDATIGKGVDIAADKALDFGKEKIGNRIIKNNLNIITGQPDIIIPQSPSSLKILKNVDFSNDGLKHFDELEYGEGISHIVRDFFDSNDIIYTNKSLEKLERELTEEEIERINTKKLFDKTPIRYKLQKPDGTIIDKTSPLSDFLPQKTIDLDGNVNVKPKAKIYNEGIPLNHDGSPLNINDAFRKAFQDEDTRRIKILNTLSNDEKINYVKILFGDDEIAKLYKKGYSEEQINKMCVNYYNKKIVDELYEDAYAVLDGNNFRPHFREDFPYETIGLDKEYSESLPKLYPENISLENISEEQKELINKQYNDYFNSLDFSLVEQEAMKEGQHINNRLAGGMSSPDETKEWLSNILGTAEKTANLTDLYNAADKIKDVSKNKGFKATMYGLINFLSEGTYDRFREIVPPYQETTARDITAWLYNKGWIESEDELIDLIDKMDKKTYYDIIAPIATIEFSKQSELNNFLRYKPSFYHNLIKNNKLYPTWKENFDLSASGKTEKDLMSNFDNSNYVKDEKGIEKDIRPFTPNEYQQFKNKLKKEQKLRRTAPRA